MDNAISLARSKLLNHMALVKKSQAAVSRELGISAGTLSQFISGTYIGSNEDVAQKIIQYLEREEERKRYTANPAFTEDLKNTKLVMSALSYVQTVGGVSTIVGSAGCGKTTALQHYAEHNNGVIYVQLDATKGSPRAVLKLITKAIGGNVKGSASDMLDKLIEEFTGTNKLIIIDEAQHLTERSFDTVRALNDKAGVSLAYSGTPDIRNRMVGRQKEELDQVYSRIGYDCELKNKYKQEEINSLFKDYNLDEDVLKTLYNISSRKGGLRLAINLFKLANDLAIMNGQKVNSSYLQTAAKRVGTGGRI